MLLVLSFLAFVSLGLPDGVLGVAWPSVRRSFGVELSQLGLLLTAAMAGYLVSSSSSGAVVARAGVGRVLVASSVLTVASSAGYALAPVWPVMVAAGVLAGLGAGAIDAGINAYAALSFSPRVVSWLHAFYGVGAALGPLLMTGVLAGGLGWRVGYGLIAALLAAMTICFAFTARLWGSAGQEPAGGEVGPPEPRPGLLETLGRPLVWPSIALFFLYTGLEITAGQWTYSLLTEARGISPTLAGTWIAAYWASLTVGRLVAGGLAGRIPPSTLLRLAMAGAPAGALLLSWNGGAICAIVGLVVLGLALAPIYPLMIVETPARLGSGATGHVVGFQVAAAYLGTAALPAAAGLLVGGAGLEVIGPFLLAGSLALFLLHEGALRLIPSRPEPGRLRPLPQSSVTPSSSASAAARSS